jgi:glycine/D-amino acid oxidase-like deaminating enzyme
MKEFECRKMAGIEVSWLQKEEILSRYGIISEGGILSAVAASMDAYQLTHALFQHACKTGALEVYDHTKLTSVDYGFEKNFVVTDTTAVIECRKIVFASGFETHELVKTGIGRLISTYACISEPFDKPPAALGDTIFWNTEEPYLYFRSTTDNRILVGGEDEAFKNPKLRDALIEKKETSLVKKLRQVMPHLPFVADFSWAGTFGATKDSLPYIGEHPDFPNSYFMLGFGGNGITFSVMGMQMLSDAIGGRQNKFLEYFRFGR